MFKARTAGRVLAVVLVLGLLFTAGLLQSTVGSAPTMTTWGTWGRKKTGTFDKPRCIRIAPDNTILVLDLTGRIQRFGLDGKHRQTFHMPDVSIGRPQSMAVDRAGNLYVADTHYFQVIKFNPEGEIVLKFGREGLAPGEFFWPCAITVAEDGTIFTAEYGDNNDRIQVWSPEGKYIRHWGTFGSDPGQFMRPMGVILDSRGHVYVADAVNHRIQVFTREGKWLRQFGRNGTAPGLFSYPYDIAIDGKDRIYTIEYGNHRVQCMDPTGRILATWGTLSNRGDGLNHPWGLDVSPEGRVAVADTYNNRVVFLGKGLSF